MIVETLASCGRFQRRVASQRSSVWQVSAKSGEPEKLGLEFGSLRQPRVHPDGSRIAFASGARRLEVWAMENFLPPPAASKTHAAGKQSDGKSE
jgi:hypothetical protein